MSPAPSHGREDLDSRLCSRCHGEMVAGSLWEHVGDGATPRAMKWYPGRQIGPRKVSVAGLFDVTVPTVPNERAAIPVVVMRCVRCGLLEAYALPEVSPPSPSETDR